jgi:Uma2 family endonuclease
LTLPLVKLMEYAEAGIPHYWVIDLDPPVSLTAYTLIEEYYQESQTVTTEFVRRRPILLRIDIPVLVAPRGATDG